MSERGRRHGEESRGERRRDDPCHRPSRVPEATRRKWCSTFEPRRFRGWTVVAEVPDFSPWRRQARRAMRRLHEASGPGEWSHHPLSSLHMTVFPGLTEYDLEPDRFGEARWGPDQTIEGLTRECLRRIEASAVPCIGPLEVEILGLDSRRDEVRVLVEITDSRQRQRVARFRELLREVLQWAAPGFDDYRFHITLAYRLTDGRLRESLAGERFAHVVSPAIRPGRIELAAPAFCVIDSMVSFPPLIRF
ncbi:DUF1868 domain-containing protein [Kocuria massiliensis]|uniref:DUF1868 domain-containing protein n=1 Tax=Kocuria massiliensis TaxID=1926282 RepID=UPI0022B95B53|nr:DUF1868 domain-containing protein [Kocuria massiliensis]